MQSHTLPSQFVGNKLAERTDIEFVVTADVVEEFTLPDPADVNWTDVTQPHALGEGQNVLQAFYVPSSNVDEEDVSFEISVAELPSDTSWLSTEESGLESVDLNELLDAGSVSAELEAIAILGENASDEAPAVSDNVNASEATELPDVAQLSQDFFFPQVTIVIDADTDSESVAF